MKLRMILAGCASCALLALAACSDDDGSRPAPTLAEIWPHADGSAWTYEVTWTVADDSTLVLPTELPTLESLHADLARPAPGAVTADGSLFYTFALDGSTTTTGGLPAQVIVGAVEPVPPDTTLGPGTIALYSPLLLGGSGTAFAFQDSAYYRYNATAAGPSWVYLAGSLVPGSTFSYAWTSSFLGRQLEARIWRVGPRTIGGVLYRDVVECLYLYDLGETDDYHGGTYRQFFGARMWFAPGVGPVAWQERSIFAARTAYAGSETFVCLENRGILAEADLPGGG